MTTPTAARTKESNSAHWYTLEGVPCHEVKKKDGTGMRASTLADARSLNLLPSVTTIIGILDKPGLDLWKMEQACLAVLTSPRKPEEQTDAFVKRVLQEEEEHLQEARKAAELGTKIHDAMESYFSGEAVPADMEVYVRPAIDHLLSYGNKASSEVILVGDDYAGLTDLIMDCEEHWRIVDFKGTKSIPEPNKGPWLEHRLQLGAYCKSFQNRLRRSGQALKPIIAMNLYLSTVKPGEFLTLEHEDWEAAYGAFANLVRIWQWQKGYKPNNPKREAEAPAVATTSTKELMLQSMLDQRTRELAEVTGQLKQLQKGQIVDALPATSPPAGVPQLQAEPEPAKTSPKLAPSIGGKRVHWDTGVVSTPPPAQAP